MEGASPLPAAVSRWRVLTRCAELWLLGAWDALQIQRCAVLIVLDSKGTIWEVARKCMLVNGVIFLGSVLACMFCVHPTISWLMRTFVRPVYGPWAAGMIETALQLATQLFWLLPAYGVTLLVSSTWYQELASAAFQLQEAVRQNKHKRGDSGHHAQPAEPGAAAGAAAGPATVPTPVRRAPLEEVAQEVYRAVFFLVFYTEVLLLAHIPYVGPLCNLVFLSWLYAYYCFDYHWSLIGRPLPERLAFVERHWAFYAGFGCPSALATIYFPFHVGAALLSLIFPIFILVAGGSDPHLIHSRLQPQVAMGRAPIFNIALWPTDYVLKLVFGAVDRSK